jgi:cytochrome c-type biogenesis protein CcmE
MKARGRRACGIAAGLTALSGATALVLNAFNANVTFFVTPTQIVDGKTAPSTRLRVGGLVVRNSLRRDAGGLTVQFAITDTAREIPVLYRGVLPDLFREGKGVVAQGRMLPNGVFLADQVLAKHDENYMPPDAANALKHARPLLRVTDSRRDSIATETGTAFTR